MSKTIVIKGTSYQVKRFDSELLMAAVVDVTTDTSNAEKQNRFVLAILPQIKGLEAEDIAVKRGGNWVLTCNIEQWFELLLNIQLIAYQDLIDKAIQEKQPLAEIRAVKSLVNAKCQKSIFEQAMIDLNEDWLESMVKIEKTSTYQMLLYEYWNDKKRSCGESVPLYVTKQLDAIPNYKKELTAT